MLGKGGRVGGVHRDGAGACRTGGLWLKPKHEPEPWHVTQSRGTCKLGMKQMLQQQQDLVHHTTVSRDKEVVMKGHTGNGTKYFLVISPKNQEILLR